MFNKVNKIIAVAFLLIALIAIILFFRNSHSIESEKIERKKNGHIIENKAFVGGDEKVSQIVRIQRQVSVTKDKGIKFASHLDLLKKRTKCHRFGVGGDPDHSQPFLHHHADHSTVRIIIGRGC